LTSNSTPHPVTHAGSDATGKSVVAAVEKRQHFKTGLDKQKQIKAQ